MADTKVIEGNISIVGNATTKDGGLAGLAPDMLQRVDTGIWETAQTGVEYFAPDQQGGIYGKVIRRYFTGTTDADTQTDIGTSTIAIAKIVASGGFVDAGSGLLITDGFTNGTIRFNTYIKNTTTFATVNESVTIQSKPYEVWIDYILLTEPTRSPSSKVMPTIDPTVLQRVDNNMWETAQTGIEYFSPDQQGGIHGKVIRMHYSGTGSTLENVPLETDFALSKTMIDAGGSMNSPTASGQINLNYVASGSSAGIYTHGGTDDLELKRGSAFRLTTDTWDIWVDYYKITPPANSPTGQPVDMLMAEIIKDSTVASDPTLLQRVDTGVWENVQLSTPTTQIDYFSPNQDGGVRGKVVRRYFGALTDEQTLGQASLLVDASVVIRSGGVGEYAGNNFVRYDASWTAGVLRNTSTNDIYADITGYSIASGWVDIILLTEPARSPSSKIMPTIDPTVLQRVDNNMWETAVEGVEYFSPDQQGGIYGKIIRRFRSGDASGSSVTLDTIDSISKFLSCGGEIVNDVEGHVPINFYSVPDSKTYMRYDEGTNIVRLIIGADYYGTSNYFNTWFDYTLVTPPANSPTGQPVDMLMAEIVKNSTVASDPISLQRVDTGTWETAQDEVDYFSPDQRGGRDGKVIRRYIPAGSINAYAIASGVDRVLNQKIDAYNSSNDGYSNPGFAGSDTVKARLYEITHELVVLINGTWTIKGGYAEYSLLTPPTRSPSSKVMPTIDPTVLQRVDDMTWETATAGVQYFSPDQHGGIHGKVVRKYYSGTGEATEIVILEADFALTKDAVGSGGVLISDTGTDNSRVLLNSYISDTVRGNIYVQGSSDDLVLIRGVAHQQSGDGWEVWADYTLQTPPTTRPTGQPFADPSSPLLKRVDTGAWELPTTGHEYVSPDQTDGNGSLVKREFFADANGISGTIKTGVTEFIGNKLWVNTANGLPTDSVVVTTGAAAMGSINYYVLVTTSSSGGVWVSNNNWKTRKLWIEYI